MTAPAVGIDLGTTYSCVAVYRNGRVEIIPNEEGARITPSYVAFTNTERLIGSAAKNQDALNPTNTIFDAKRLIGRKFNDSTVQEDMKIWPFEVINDSNKPKIKVQYKGQQKIFSPEEISAMVLMKLKSIAETYLGKKVEKAVITVPAYFNDSQRQATKDAGAIAGLNVLRVINETTAAALAYGLGEENLDERNVLIFDLGGGTFDVSILNIEEGIFEVKSTTGDTHLGGEDFDQRMVRHLIEEIKRKHKKDISTNKGVLRRLRTACERAKRVLSTSNQASIDLELLFDGQNFQTCITRACFEELNKDLFELTIKLVDNAIKAAGMKKTDIDDIVLVGGSTRIPKVQMLLREYFNGKNLVQSINPDEAVGYGAAVQAAIMEDEASEEIKEMVLIDVTPLSLGINVLDGTTSKLIERNTTIPVKTTKPFTTSADFQSCVNIEVYEGERLMSKENNFLGQFTLNGIPLARRGVPQIDVTFDINTDGILHVTAVEKTTQKKGNIKIVNEKGRLTQEEIDRMVQEAERFRREDEELKEKVAVRNELDHLCYSTKNKMEDRKLAAKLKIADRDNILRKCNEIITWLDLNQNANKADFQSRLRELKAVREPYKNIL